MHTPIPTLCFLNWDLLSSFSKAEGTNKRKDAAHFLCLCGEARDVQGRMWSPGNTHRCYLAAPRWRWSCSGPPPTTSNIHGHGARTFEILMSAGWLRCARAWRWRAPGFLVRLRGEQRHFIPLLKSFRRTATYRQVPRTVPPSPFYCKNLCVLYRAAVPPQTAKNRHKPSETAADRQVHNSRTATNRHKPPQAATYRNRPPQPPTNRLSLFCMSALATHGKSCHDDYDRHHWQAWAC